MHADCASLTKRMNDDKYHVVRRSTQRNPSFFRLAMLSIRNRDGQRIQKNCRSLFEAYTMLQSILARLRWIPIKIVFGNDDLPNSSDD